MMICPANLKGVFRKEGRRRAGPRIREYLARSTGLNYDKEDQTGAGADLHLLLPFSESKEMRRDVMTIITGRNYRISLLTSRLIRLE